LNRISIRGVAVATAIASTSILAASGIAASASSGDEALDTLRSGQRSGGTPDLGASVVRSALEPATRVTPTATPRRATRSVERTGLAPRELGRLMAVRRGWTGRQWTCLDKLWTRESNWQVRAQNGSSGAYGIPQSLPGRKMAMFGDNWRTSAGTQIKWGLWYIERSYGTPCDAWRHSRNHGYY
jgi:hypothetical protein